jgi:DNA-binding response OmpR family regulator
MPGMNGWQLADRLRQAGFSRAPIVMMSANVHEIGPARGADAPHDEMIPKPFDLRRLLDRLQALLQLEWTYEVPPSPVPVAARAVTPPAAEQIEELIRLGQIGYVRGIEAKLSELELETALQEPFVRQMRDIVQSYDFQRYLAVLEGMRSDG